MNVERRGDYGMKYSSARAAYRSGIVNQMTKTSTKHICHKEIVSQHGPLLVSEVLLLTSRAINLPPVLLSDLPSSPPDTQTCNDMLGVNTHICVFLLKQLYCLTSGF